MKKRRVKIRLALLAAALSASLWASFAWACVPYPLLTVGPRSSGPVGTDVKVSGVSFAPGQIEVRWNAIDGPVLGTAGDPDFSLNAKIPQADEGMYAIVALTRDGDGGVSSLARASFLVTGPDGSAPELRPETGPAPRADPVTQPNSAGMLLAGGGLVALGVFLGALFFRRRSPRPGTDKPGLS